MRFLIFEFILIFFPHFALGVQFVNPPPSQLSTDFSFNSIYVEGSLLNIQWTAGPAGNNTIVTLYQQNGSDSIPPIQYLAENVSSDITSFAWTVQTTANLSVSNVFFLVLYLVGAHNAEAISHSFNITAKDSGNSNPSTTTTSAVISATNSITQPSLVTSAKPDSTTAPASLQSSTSTSIPSSLSNGLSTGAAGGIGVGASIAGILGVGALIFFFFFRRPRVEQKLQQQQQQQHEPFGKPELEAVAQQERLHTGNVQGEARVFELHEDSRMR